MAAEVASIMSQDSFGRSARALGVGALVGVSAGFVLGLLVAPEEGSRMRRRVSYHLEGLRRQVRELLDSGLKPDVENEARRSGQALVTEVQTRAQEISDKIDAVLGGVSDQGRK